MTQESCSCGAAPESAELSGLLPAAAGSVVRYPKGQTSVFFSVEKATAASQEMAVRRSSFSTICCGAALHWSSDGSARASRRRPEINVSQQGALTAVELRKGRRRQRCRSNKRPAGVPGPSSDHSWWRQRTRETIHHRSFASVMSAYIQFASAIGRLRREAALFATKHEEQGERWGSKRIASGARKRQQEPIHPPRRLSAAHGHSHRGGALERRGVCDTTRRVVLTTCRRFVTITPISAPCRCSACARALA